MLTLQMIQLMDVLWKQEGLDLRWGPIPKGIKPVITTSAGKELLSVQGDNRKLGEAKEGRPGIHLAPSALPGLLPALESSNLFPSPHDIAGASPSSAT